MRYFTVLGILAMVGCSGAGEPAPDVEAGSPDQGAEPQAVNDEDTASNSDAMAPVHTLSLGEGRRVSWYELVPGAVVTLGVGLDGQWFPDGLSVVEQFEYLAPGQQVPSVLTELELRVDELADATPEEVLEVAKTMGFSGLTAAADLNEDADQIAAADPAFDANGLAGEAEQVPTPGLEQLATQDTGSDAAFPRSTFMTLSGCTDTTPLDFKRETRRTGDDTSEAKNYVFAKAHAASYRGTIGYEVHARLRYFWANYQKLADQSVSSGNMVTVTVSSDAWVALDIKTKVKNASGDGWHACIIQDF